jgi:hypothetical protein
MFIVSKLCEGVARVPLAEQRLTRPVYLYSMPYRKIDTVFHARGTSYIQDIYTALAPLGSDTAIITGADRGYTPHEL